MNVLDQSFSAQNFGVIYSLFNRQGKIDVTLMSADYQQVVADIKSVRADIRNLKQKRSSTWTDDDTLNYDIYRGHLKTLEKEKAEKLSLELESFANTVNSRGFKFVINKHTYDAHEEFTIDASALPTKYALCQLQHNMKKTFKVEMANRHTTMVSLKRLLNTKMPLYIIRTDVSGFFESIPQEILLKKVQENTLLSYKSKSFIQGIMNAYEDVKDTALVSSDVGVPRGVGISSILSEIYMQDLDKEIRNRKEVVFYVRYVDDIFIVMTSIHPYATLEDYYKELEALFSRNGLTLKSIGDSKCQLVDFVNNRNHGTNFEYLGYRISLSCTTSGLITKYGMSAHRKDTIKNRIDKAFLHFEHLSKINIKQARRDLLDSLNIITGNIRLHSTKSGVKVGLYYNNDLLDDIGMSDLAGLTGYLRSRSVNPYVASFASAPERAQFISKLQSKIAKYDFKTRWEKKVMYSYPIDRVAEIMVWL